METINNWIVGKQVFTTGEHRKRVLLSGYFLLVFTVLGLLWLSTKYYTYPEVSKIVLTAIFMVSNTICFLLIRSGWFYLGTFLTVARMNIIITYIAWVYPHTYFDLLFITCGTASLAIFGYEKKWIGIGCSLLSAFLYFTVSISLYGLTLKGSHFDNQLSFMLTYGSVFSVIYFFNYLTYQYDLVIRSQNSELKKANEELDRFVYTASHDLKAPLNSITGLVSLMKTTEDAGETRLFIQMIEKSVASMKGFITEVTDLSRNSRTEVTYSDVYVSEMVDEIHRSLEFYEKAEHVLWQREFPADLIIRTDPYRLRISLNNLLSNAVKYSDLSRSNPFVKISTSQTSSHLTITIEDNGIGIPADKLPQLFQMFYRATDKESGSGLGLYIAKESIGKLKGTLEVRSVYERGTTFIITLPV